MSITGPTTSTRPRCERFQKETGINVRYDVFDSLETLEASCSPDSSGYDVVVPTNEPTFSRLITCRRAGRSTGRRVPNWANLDPALMQRVESSDPGNRHGAIYLWGTIGLGIIPDRVRALAPDAPLDSWDLLFKPENAPPDRALRHHHDGFGDRRDSRRCCNISAAIPTAPTRRTCSGRERTLMAIRPYIRSFASGGALEALATGRDLPRARSIPAT